MGTPGQGAIQELLDKEAIREVVVRFCRGVDRDDVQLLSSVYHPDAVDVHGGTFSGPNLAADLLDYVTSLNSPVWHHEVSNILVELQGPDAAVCESYYNAYFIITEDGNSHVARAIGRYLDKVERRDGEWRITSRLTVGDLGWTEPLDESGLLPGQETAPDHRLTGRRDRTDPSYRWFSGVSA
jgi:hypothetical protein